MRKIVFIILGATALLAAALLPTGFRPADAVGAARADTLTPAAYLPLIMMPPIEPGLAADPTIGFAPLTVQFTNTSSGPYTFSLWDFGDGITSTLTHPGHAYSAVGTYTVTLSVGRAGITHTITQTNYIHAYTPSQLLDNPSFENGWTNVGTGTPLVNQQPNDWTLYWVPLGQPIFGSADVASGIPECVHKHNSTLPPHEQLGGPNALILDGEYTYKLFHYSAPFGAQLSQTVTGLRPNSAARLVVPVQVHLHGDPDEWGAASGVWIEGSGTWISGFAMGDRQWYYHTVDFTVPADGQIDIAVRFKGRNWWLPKDFFVDDLVLIATQ